MKRLKSIFYVFVLIIVLILYLGIKEVGKPKREAKIAAITDKVLGNEEKIPEYIYRNIGSSNLKIKSPYELQQSNLKIPDGYKESIEKLEVFEFEKNPFFEGKVSYFKWISTVSYDLKTGIDGAIDNIKKLPGVEKVVDNRTYFENSKYQAYFYDAIMLRDSKSGILRGAILKSGQETWSISFGITESKNEEIIIRILESLKENN